MTDRQRNWCRAVALPIPRWHHAGQWAGRVEPQSCGGIEGIRLRLGGDSLGTAHVAGGYRGTEGS